MLVVVLNDGETYTDIDGCVVLEVPDEINDDEVDSWVKEHAHEGVTVSEMDTFYNER